MLYILYYVLINLMLGILFFSSKTGKQAYEDYVEHVKNETGASRKAATNAMAFVVIIAALPLAAVALSSRPK